MSSCQGSLSWTSHYTMLLERRRREACHKQSCNTGSGRKAHPVRGIKLTSVKAVWISLPCVWVVQLSFFICVVDGWLAKYYKKVTTKSQKEIQAQVYKVLKQEISFQHGSNWKQCNVTCFAKSEPTVRICCLISCLVGDSKGWHTDTQSFHKVCCSL